MKPPVDINKLAEMWIEDVEIDETEPGRELIKIPKLHAKYLRILTHHSLTVKKLSSDYNTRRRIKWEYYNGDLNNPDDLERYKLPPMEKKILRADINTYLDSDQELNDILLKKVYHEEIVDFCKSVVRELNNRTYQLRASIEWAKFTGGL
jgi:Recombination, repair and ssDNA binding protein UvsY